MRARMVKGFVAVVGALVFSACVGAGADPDGGSGGGNDDEQQAVPTIASDFSSDADGWGTYNDAQEAPGVGYDDANDYVFAIDAGQRIWWYFDAPDEFLSNKEAYYGGSLSYQLLMLTTSGTDDPHDIADVILEADVNGNSVAISVELGLVPNDADWTTFSVSLSTDDAWVVESTGDLATEEEIRDVLSSLTALRICGEYRTGSDSSALRNVVMSGP